MRLSALPCKNDAVAAPSRPVLALPPRPAQRRGLWALPLLLSLLFVGAALTWLVHTEEDEREQQRQDLISDALSLEVQLSARIGDEARLLREAADRFHARLVGHARGGAGVGAAVSSVPVSNAPVSTAPVSTAPVSTAPGPTAALSAAVLAAETPDGRRELVAVPEVQAGLRRFWLSLTWLDARNRIVSHLPEEAPQEAGAWLRNAPVSGLSAHLAAPLPEGGALVARYSPSNLLRQTVPWWLARKYDVRLVDSFGDVMASTAEGREPPDRQSYRIAVDPVLADSYLELIARDRITPWYRSFPMVIVAGFLLLIGAITAMLRRQVEDVSRAEANWRTEAAWRSAMEDSLTVGLRARNLEGRVLYVNRALCDLIGYAPDELVDLMPPMPYWPPDSLGEIMVRHARNLAGQAPRGGYEARWQHRDGRLLDVMVFEAPLVDSGGEHVGWMGSILDISEKKRLEERERRQIEEVTHHARLTMLGEVASTLAHELNQPLTAISSYTAGVLNSLQRPAAGAGSPPDPVVLRALQRLGEQAAHAGRIVQRIRAFLTRREPQLEPASLNAIVAGGVALLQRELARQRVTLALQLDADLPEVVADAVLIEQVVINLVRNACDALADQPAAGLARERRIEVRTLRSADDAAASLRVEVSDNGPGLQGRPIEALCAPFYSTKADGMGMGLAICRSILEAHQGTLEAGDLASGGARFALTLPLDLRSSGLSVDEGALAT